MRDEHDHARPPQDAHDGRCTYQLTLSEEQARVLSGNVRFVKGVR